MNWRLFSTVCLLGAVFGTVIDAHAATAEEFGYDTMGARPHPNRPLLLLVAEFTSTPARASGGIPFPAVARNPLNRTQPEYDDFVFDFLNLPPNPAVFAGQTINAAFLEMSAGAFVWTRAASFPRRRFSMNETQALEESSEPFGPPPGRAYGIETTPGLNFIVGKFLSDNSSFNLAAFDLNGDAIVSENELTVLLISNYAERGAANRSLNLGGLPNSADPSRPITLRGPIAWCDHRTSFTTWLHELSHSIRTVDLYNGIQIAPSGNNTNAFGFRSTLMGGTLDIRNNDNPATWHMDPWHKMKLGWLRPRLVPLSQGGGFVLRCAQAPGAEGAILIYDDSLPLDKIAREFFMIEDP